jgi:hypothetical protein
MAPTWVPVRTTAPILVAVAMLVGCGGAGRVDTRDVERALMADFVVVEDVAIEAAECPNQVDRGTGGSFVCNVQIDGQDLPVRVSQIDEDGTVRFEQQRMVFESSRVAAQVASEVGREAGQLVTASCGESVLIVVDVDDEVRCVVVDENGGRLVVVARLGDEGVLSVQPA